MQSKRRRAQVDDDLSALLNQTAHWFDIVKWPRQIMFRPNIFANSHADFFAARIKRFGPTSRLEVAVFIEHIVSGQERLMGFANRFAFLEQSSGVMKRLAAPFIAINETDKQGHVPHPRMKLLEDLKILWDEARLKDEILRRVSGNGQLRGEDQFRPGTGKTFIRAQDQLKIAVQISDGRVNLSKANLHSVPCRLCATQLAAILFCVAQLPSPRRPNSCGSKRGLANNSASVCQTARVAKITAQPIRHYASAPQPVPHLFCGRLPQRCCFLPASTTDRAALR